MNPRVIQRSEIKIHVSKKGINILRKRKKNLNLDRERILVMHIPQKIVGINPTIFGKLLLKVKCQK